MMVKKEGMGLEEVGSWQTLTHVWLLWRGRRHDGSAVPWTAKGFSQASGKSWDKVTHQKSTESHRTGSDLGSLVHSAIGWDQVIGSMASAWTWRFWVARFHGWQIPIQLGGICCLTLMVSTTVCFISRNTILFFSFLVGIILSLIIYVTWFVRVTLQNRIDFYNIWHPRAISSFWIIFMSNFNLDSIFNKWNVYSFFSQMSLFLCITLDILYHPWSCKSFPSFLLWSE